MARILIVDDDPEITSILEENICQLGHDVDVAGTISTAMAMAKKHKFELVFLDAFLPDGYGLNYITDLQQTPGKPDIIIITGSTDMDGAALAMESGAWDYICKPFIINKAKFQLGRVLEYRRGRSKQPKCTALKRDLIIGSSPQLNLSLDKVAQAATTRVNVLLTGESGTGKELFARAIHDNSPWSQNPFVVLDCSVLPEKLVENTLFGHEKGAFTGANSSSQGLIGLADNGTLFIDEVGELSMDAQKIFLRVLQERQYRPVGGAMEIHSNFRLVAATNKDLDQLVEEGRFRQDLLYRLKAFTIDLAPLRMRISDIPAISLYHLSRICRQNNMENKGLSHDFIEAIEEFSWPGNVRELINSLERAVASATFSPLLFPVHLPGRIRMKNLEAKIHPGLSCSHTLDHAGHHMEEFPTLKAIREKAIAEVETRYLNELNTMSGENVKEACRLSGLKRTRLWELYKKYNIEKG